MDEITRRRTLAMGMGLAVAACGGGGGNSGSGTIIGGGTTPTPPPPTPSPTPSATASPTPSPTATASIKAAAAAKNTRFGSCVAWTAGASDAASFRNPNYAAIVEAECSSIVAENEMKWEAIRPNEATFSFTRGDEMLAWAESKGIAMRGHTLLWYLDTRFPGWLRNYDFSGDARGKAENLIRTHVQRVASHYGDRIRSWDVVNEAIEPSTGAIRDHNLGRAVGGDTSLLDLAFRTARAALPTAELVYNDYMDGGTPNHRRGVLELLRGFKARGVPVDTLGVQSHIGFYSQDPLDPVQNVINFNINNMKPFLDEVVALGYKLKITELDVNDRNRGGTIEQRDAASAAFARAWVNLFLSYPQTNEVLAWGMVDKYNWLQSFITPRTDGQPLRPTVYDANFQPKPLRAAYIEAFNAATVRPA